MVPRGPMLAILGGAAAFAYVHWYRPWQLTWGATPEEVSRPLPGDELVPRPGFNATRAITLAAAPDRVWPWLVQAGVTRAGWYSYDLLDNLGRRSADHIVPELQHLRPGDLVPMSPDGRHGILVHTMDPPRTMVWGTPGESSWVWFLESTGDGATRLITRVRMPFRWSSPSIAFALLVEVADVWMMRKMLLTLQDRIARANS